MKIMLTKLAEIVERREFQRIEFHWKDKKFAMMGIVLKPNEWKQYQQIIPGGTKPRLKNCLWFRAHPVVPSGKTKLLITNNKMARIWPFSQS